MSNSKEITVFDSEAEFLAAFDRFELDNEYADYIITHGDIVIGNSHRLVAAMDTLYLYEEFKAAMIVGCYQGA